MSESSFVTLPLGRAKEREAAPEGEYDLRIAKCSVEKTKKEPIRDMIVFQYDFVGQKDYNPIRENIVIPNANDKGADQDFAAIRIKRIAQACDVHVDDNGFNPEDFVGAEGRAYVSQREYEGNTQNDVRWPKLRGETR